LFDYEDIDHEERVVFGRQAESADLGFTAIA
jgi:hypothetical protein